MQSAKISLYNVKAKNLFIECNILRGNLVECNWNVTNLHNFIKFLFSFAYNYINGTL